MTNNFIVLRADAETPSCARCDRHGIAQDWCDKLCGPKYNWDMYRRTIELNKRTARQEWAR